MLLCSLTCQKPLTVSHTITYRKTKCLWFCYEINSFYFRVPQKPKTENKNWVHLQRMFGVPQGSILGPLLFLIFTADLFYLNSDLDFASDADDTTPYIYGHDVNNIIKVLEPNVNKLFNWFRQNGLLANSGKSHFLTSSFEERSLKIHDSYNFKFLRRTFGGFDG